jgi:hypothetical protein
MADCHAVPEGKGSFCCGYSEGSMPDELAFDLSACAGSEVALGESRLQWQSSFSQLRLSENRRKQFFHLQQRGTLRATSSSTLSNSTNGWLAWQRRS